MALIINMPVNVARVFCNSTAGNNNNQNQFSLQIKRFQQSLCKANIITISTGKNKS